MDSEPSSGYYIGRLFPPPLIGTQMSAVSLHRLTALVRCGVFAVGHHPTPKLPWTLAYEESQRS
jgi:hypothetical protein